MKFSELAAYLEKLESTSSRLAITDILADLYNKTDSDEIEKSVYLSLGYLAPSYRSIILNIAEKMALQSVSQAFDKDLETVKKDYKKLGDIGNLAEKYSSQKSSALSVEDVYGRLVKIANYEGEGSQDKKIDGLANLLHDLDKLSVRYLVRIPVGKLRLGFSEKTVIDALAQMRGDKSLKTKINKAYEVLPDIGRIAYLVKKHGAEKLKVAPEFGVPVMPMLAARLKSPDEMIKKMGEVSVEPKFDGLRALIHYKKGQSPKIFTRNLNEVTQMFPEIEDLEKHIKADSAILDSEAIGVDPETERMVDFQKTISRKRKHGVDKSSKDTPLWFQIFDVVMINGENLMGKPYVDRRAKLEKLFDKNKVFSVDENTITDDPEVIRDLHEKYLKEGLEGVIVKRADSKYVAGRTGWRWVKMKEVESAHARLSDTLDCVVMGYTQGKGKRAEFGIGQFLAGVVDGEKIKTITKVGTGLTDDQFREMKKRLSKLEVKNIPKNYEVDRDLVPDFWVEPELVVELAADEITKSPKHTAGYALRFPRLIKFRDDKSEKEATTLAEVKRMFKNQ